VQYLEPVFLQYLKPVFLQYLEPVLLQYLKPVPVLLQYLEPVFLQHLGPVFLQYLEPVFLQYLEPEFLQYLEPVSHRSSDLQRANSASRLVTLSDDVSADLRSVANSLSKCLTRADSNFMLFEKDSGFLAETPTTLRKRKNYEKKMHFKLSIHIICKYIKHRFRK
jgi:hypothetical protein